VKPGQGQYRQLDGRVLQSRQTSFINRISIPD
jgi:hypothetical protein